MITHKATPALPARYLLILIGCAGLLLSFLTSSTPSNYVVEIAGQPFFPEQYQTAKQFADVILETSSFDKTDFIHRQLLIHAAERHGYTVTRQELTRFLQEAPLAFKRIFTANDEYLSTRDTITRQKAQQFAQQSILEQKMRAQLGIPQAQALVPLQTTVKVQVVPAKQIKVRQPSGAELYRYYNDHLAQYTLAQYKVRVKKIDQAAEWSTPKIEAVAESNYLQHPLRSYQVEQRIGYIVKCVDLNTHRNVLKSLQKNNILPTALRHYIKENITTSEYDNSPYVRALFSLDLQKKYYTAISPQCYLVLAKVIPAQKAPFPKARTLFLMNQLLQERQQALKTKKQTLLEHSKNISQFLTDQQADTVTLDVVDDYSYFQPIISFLKQNQQTYGIVPISDNVDFVFESLAKTSQTLSFTAALPQVQRDYRAAAQEHVVQSVCKQERGIAQLPWKTKNVTLIDDSLPETVRHKILAAPLRLMDYVLVDGVYYLFQKLTAITPAQLSQHHPFAELSVFQVLKKQYQVKLAPQRPTPRS